MKLFNADGMISEINVKPRVRLAEQITAVIGGELDFIELLGDDLLIINQNQHDQPQNDLATIFARRPVFGPAVHCEPEEIDNL